MTKINMLVIICVVWGIIMLIIGIGAINRHDIRDIGLSFVTQAILSFIVAIGLSILSRQER